MSALDFSWGTFQILLSVKFFILFDWCSYLYFQRLRRRYVIRRNQRKRQRDEKSEKGDENGSEKRVKTNDETPTENDPTKSEKKDASNQNANEENMALDARGTVPDEPKIENKIEDDDVEYEEEEEEEDPEEIVEEDQEMDDAAAAPNDAADQDVIILSPILCFQATVHNPPLSYHVFRNIPLISDL